MFRPRIRLMGHPMPQLRAKADLPVGFPYRFNSSVLNVIIFNSRFWYRLTGNIHQSHRHLSWYPSYFEQIIAVDLKFFFILFIYLLANTHTPLNCVAILFKNGKRRYSYLVVGRGILISLMQTKYTENTIRCRRFWLIQFRCVGEQYKSSHV